MGAIFRLNGAVFFQTVTAPDIGPTTAPDIAPTTAPDMMRWIRTKALNKTLAVLAVFRRADAGSLDMSGSDHDDDIVRNVGIRAEKDMILP